MTTGNSSLKRPALMILFSSALVAASALTLLVVRGEEPSALVAGEEPGPKPPQALNCAPGELGMTEHIDFVDLPGGHHAPDGAMEEWLSRNADGITLRHLVPVVPGGSNAGYAEYEYRTEEGTTIARFSVNLAGDSWHVTDWEGCNDQTKGLLDRAE